MTIIVIDPCEDAIVNSENSLILEDLIAPDGVESYESKIYTRPPNSVELAYGDQSNCGKYFFTILTSDEQLFIEDWINIESTPEG